MDKFAQQFQNDVVVRYQQKMAALVKTAGDEGGEMQGVTKAWTQDVPETTWFESLSNSAPVSALLDAAEATGVDRWADTAKGFAGDIGANIGDWIGDLERGSEGDIAKSIAQIMDNNAFNSMQNEAIDTFNRYKKENPFADVSFVPQADQGVLSVRMDKSPWTLAKNRGLDPYGYLDTLAPLYNGTVRHPKVLEGVMADMEEDGGYNIFHNPKALQALRDFIHRGPRVSKVNPR